MKVTVWSESTGWTLIVLSGTGAFLGRHYVSMRHNSGAHDTIEELKRLYNEATVDVVWAGKSADYDREMHAIANDPHFMS